MDHTSALSHENAREPLTRCAGNLRVVGNTFHSDVHWTITECESCGCRVFLADGYRPHWWNYEEITASIRPTQEGTEG